jgi:hypothetical protein
MRLPLFFLLSCVMPPHVVSVPPCEDIPVWISDEFTPGEHDSIRAALADWNVAAGEYVFFHQAREAYPTSLFITKASSDSIDGVADNYLGWIDRVNGRNVHLRADMIADRGYDLSVITEHEIGHALGLADDKRTPKTLMAEYATNSSNCIDHRTLKILAYTRGWEPSKLIQVCP